MFPCEISHCFDMLNGNAQETIDYLRYSAGYAQETIDYLRHSAGCIHYELWPIHKQMNCIHLRVSRRLQTRNKFRAWHNSLQVPSLSFEHWWIYNTNLNIFIVWFVNDSKWLQIVGANAVRYYSRNLNAFQLYSSVFFWTFSNYE